jgi:hypothetical protein
MTLEKMLLMSSIAGASPSPPGKRTVELTHTAPR